MTYPGGKGAVFRHIINEIPPHDVYIETHLGAGSVMRNKRPARLNIGVEVNRAVLIQSAWEIAPGAELTATNGDAVGAVASIGKNNYTYGPVSRVSLSDTPEAAANTNKNGDNHRRYAFLCMDALQFLGAYPFIGSEFVYLDPPYLMETRRNQRQLYLFEYGKADHIELLAAIVGLPCRVAISGYWSEVYNERLAGWRSISFQAKTRGGPMATEYLWMNYPKPKRLHDYAFLGHDFRERERISRRKARWVARLARMDEKERAAVLWAIDEAGFFNGKGETNDNHIYG